MFEQLSSLGIKFDDVAVLLVLLIQIGISVGYSYLPLSVRQSPLFNRVFYSAIGVFSSAFIFGWRSTLVIIPVILIQYIGAWYCKTPKGTMATSLLAFAAVTLCHIYRYFTDYYGNSNSIINILMLQMPKIVYFFWHCHSLYSKAKGSVAELPSIVDYFVYMFSFVGQMTGPAYNYEEHSRLIHLQNEDGANKRSKIIGRIGLAVGCLAFYGAGTAFNAVNYTISEKFEKSSILARIFFIYMSGYVLRSRYYTAWSISEIIGFQLNLKDSHKNYNEYIENINIKVVETELSMKVRLDNWNISIATWLRYCFYEPSIQYFGVSKENASLFTIMLSGFWHGFYPVYYIAFFCMYVITQTERIFYKKGMSSFPLKFLYSIEANLLGTTFSFFDWDKAKRYIGSNWDIFMIYPVLYIIAVLWPKQKRTQKSESVAQESNEKKDISKSASAPSEGTELTSSFGAAKKRVRE